MIDKSLHTPPLLDLLLQPSLLQRLRDEIIAPSVQRTIPISRQTRSRQSNNNNGSSLLRRRIGGPGVSTLTSSLQPPDLLRCRQPVHHGHANIHEYKVELPGFPLVDCFEAVGGCVPANV